MRFFKSRRKLNEKRKKKKEKCRIETKKKIRTDFPLKINTTNNPVEHRGIEKVFRHKYDDNRLEKAKRKIVSKTNEIKIQSIRFFDELLQDFHR